MRAWRLPAVSAVPARRAGGCGRAAPIAAAVCAVVAAGARWTGWSGSLSLAVLRIAVGGARRLRPKRPPRARDLRRTAVEIDGLAHLGGELRSASWFARATAKRSPSTPIPNHRRPDSWVDYHLDARGRTAAGHGLDRALPAGSGANAPRRRRRCSPSSSRWSWRCRWPAAPASMRSGSATGAARSARPRPTPSLRLAAAELLKTAPGAPQEGRARGQARGDGRADRGRVPRSAGEARCGEGSPEAEQDAKRGLDPNAKKMGAQAQELKDLAERLKRAATIDVADPRSARRDDRGRGEALRDEREASASSPKDPKEAIGRRRGAPGGRRASEERTPSKFDDSSIKSVKDASAGGGVGRHHDVGRRSARARRKPGSVSAAHPSGRKGGGTMPDLGAALQEGNHRGVQGRHGREDHLDNRRKTERGTATVALQRPLPPAAFEKGRATAPPAVPEKRRAAVQTYFIRKQ